MNPEDLIKSFNDYLQTETTLRLTHNPQKILAAMMERKTTGQLIFFMNQGGVQKVSLVERTRATAAESERIRELLWNGSK